MPTKPECLGKTTDCQKCAPAPAVGVCAQKAGPPPSRGRRREAVNANSLSCRRLFSVRRRESGDPSAPRPAAAVWRRARSELQPQGELELTRGAGADIVRGEAVVVAIEIHDAVDLAEIAVRNLNFRIGVLIVIEDIKGFSAELEVEAFGKPHRLAQSHIRLPDKRTADQAAAGIAESTVGGHGENRRIDPVVDALIRGDYGHARDQD